MWFALVLSSLIALAITPLQPMNSVHASGYSGNPVEVVLHVFQTPSI